MGNGIFHDIISCNLVSFNKTNNLGTPSFVSEFSVMDPGIEINERPIEISSTVAGNDNPDNAGWIYIV